MKIIWLIALVLVVPVCRAETDDSDHNSFASATARAFEMEKQADFVADYATDGKLDIGIGRTDNEQGIHHSIRFSLEELEDFFDDQRHKNSIVVVVAKNLWTDEELQNHVLKLRDYFIARGYKKVIIQKGSGGGRGIHLEYDAKAKESE